MSNYPGDIDDDSTLPVVNDNLTEVGGDAINALRDAVVQIETALGTNIAGVAPSLAARLGVFINPDGTPNASVLTSLGLVTLPIRDDQIAENAGIPESKLRLDYRTQDLFNYIRDLSLDVNTVAGWISVTGIKLDPHLIGAIYRHTLDQIDVSNLTANYLKNNLRLLRNNAQSYALVNDINNELLAHQWADGSPFGIINDIVTNNGSTYPSNYGHTASGIFLNASRFTHIPHTDEDLQLFAEFVDGNIINQLVTLQNLDSNGISKVSRSSSLLADGYGQPLVSITPAVAYLKHLGNSSSPYDDIDTGDDIIEFVPSTVNSSNRSFDEQFALVRVGDIVRINYGTVEVPFLIKEKKYVPTPGNKRYLVRIAGKNLSYSPNASARIDRSLVNSNKYGVLAVAPANNTFSEIPSLIVTSPRGGEALGLGFSPDEFNESHYQLYLALYPDGNPADGYTFLPAIDVTGNQGITPGLYTLDSIVEATNTAFRKVGFNYRFIAFSYQGEFGIALADSYNNASFSVVNGVVAPGGTFDQSATVFNFPNNVIDLFPSVGTVALDPLGFGTSGANIASPPYLTSYGSEAASQYPTKLFVPLTRNNVYINGAEKERLSLEIGQALDTYGDGYWVAEILEPPGSPPAGRVETTYRIQLDLSATNLKAGKTLVVQSLGHGTLVDFGRFIIESITFGCNPTSFTDITVYDAVHAKGFSPTTTLGADGYVALYFNSDSVSFNEETATDFTTVSAFKRHFEVYIDENVNTFTHERGRMLISAPSVVVNGITLLSSTGLAKFDLVRISPKLRGYQFGSVNKITLNITNYDDPSGIFTGYLASYDGVTFTHLGPFTTGKKGETVRFYDETNIDYIDIILDVNTVISNFSSQQIDIQLFPTLSLDDQIMLIGTCQLNDSIKKVTRVRDERQFGNISTEQLSTSTLDYIALPDKLLHFNGVIRGFDIADVTSNIITFNGGVALVSGKFQFINNQIFSIPKVSELFAFTSYPINWALCVNSIGELVIIPLTDFDSVVGTPNSPNRVVTVTNAVTLNTYAVDAYDFKTILNTRKDLTMLYVVTSTVTGTGTGAVATLGVKDIRRYVNDQDSNMPAVVNNNLAAQGNFKDINTALNWIRLDNALQSELILKGAISAISNNFTYTTGQLSIRPGGSGATLKFSGTANVANFRLTDMPTLVGGGNGTFATTIFDNSPLTVNSAGTLTSVNLIKCGACSFVGNLTATNTNFTDGTVSVGPTATLTNVALNGCPLTVSGGPATTLTSVRLTRSATNIGSSSGTTLLTNATVNNSPITIAGTGGIELDGTSVVDSAISAGGAATIGVVVTGGVSTGTSFLDSSLTSTTTLTATSALFNRTNVTANGAVLLTSTRFVDSNLTTAASASLTTSSGSYENVTFSSVLTASLTSTRFINCTMTVSTTSTISSCVFQNCTVTLTGSTNITNTSFIDCTLVFTAGGTFTNVVIDPSTVTIGGTITVTSTVIKDSTIASSAVNTFLLVNDFRLERNKITWTGTPVTGYSSSDIVNSGNGMIWAAIGSTSVNNIFVKDNIFTSSLQDHFPFFALQMNSYSSVANNINVTGNSFLSTANGDDIRAVVAVISTLVARTATTAYPQAPALIDVHFDNNICNYNQLIIISSIKDYTGGYMNGAAPLTINTTINGNVCGTIGYFISSFAPFDGTNVGAPNNGTIRDKSNKLIIANNFCKLITNLDSVGDYICFRATNFPANNFYEEVASTIGEASILNNECNWIQVGAGGYIVGQSGVNIIGNTVSPANATFLNNFTSFGFQSVAPSNVGILLRREFNAVGLSSSIISENNVVQKFTSSAAAGLTITNASNASPIVITTSGSHGFSTGQLVNISGVTGNTAANGTWIVTVVTGTTFSLNGSAGNGVYAGGGTVVSPNIYYYLAGIVCFNHARITNNVIAGVVNSSTAPLMYFWDIDSQIVTGNTLERRSLSCNAYFYMDGLSGSGTAAQKLIISQNTMDAADPGSGVVNRYFIGYGTGYATGAAASAVQTGWHIEKNVAGVQPTFVYV